MTLFNFVSFNSFNSKIAAGVLSGLGMILMIASIATGHEARSNLSGEIAITNKDIALNVWQAAGVMVDKSKEIFLVDVRSTDKFNLYSISGATNLPAADAHKILASTSKTIIIVVADDDEKAGILAAKIAFTNAGKQTHYLKGGAGAWFLKLELPVPLFSKNNSPIGYDQAILVVKQYFSKQPFSKQPSSSANADKTKIKKAIENLSRMAFEPSELKKSGSNKSGSNKKKKIAGGCG